MTAHRCQPSPQGLVLLALGFLWAFVSPVLALDPDRAVKDYRVNQWGIADGLPYASVAALAQSADGYLWIGTRTGLCRFDGVRFTTYTTRSLRELGSDRIISLCTTRDGTLWIGTARGITWYRQGKWSRPHLSAAVDEGTIIAMAEADDGSLIIAHAIDQAQGERGSILFRYRDGICTEIKRPDGTDYPRINQIVRLPQDGIVAAGPGVFTGPADAMRDISEKLSIPETSLLSVAVDHEGTFWFGCRTGLIRWNGHTSHAFTSEEGLPSDSVRSLIVDCDGNLWIGTANGLARYAHGIFAPLLIHGLENLSNVLCLFEDAERNLWVGTDNGLLRVQDVKVTTLGQRDGLPVNPTLCVLQGRDDRRWVGTIGGGLASISGHEIQTIRIKDGLLEDSIGALAEGTDGTLWFAYYSRGLGSYANGRVTNYSPGNTVRFRGLAVDRDGTIWAASSDGLFRFYQGEFVREPLDPALAFPRALHVDQENHLWVAGAKAFGCRRDGKWAVFSKPADFVGQPFQWMFSDSVGGTWVLQDGPLVIRIRGQRVEKFTFSELGPLVYGGFEYRGDLWINFRAGVARIPLSEFDQVADGRKDRPTYTLFDASDGMRSLAPNNIGSPGAAPMPDGSLWFATSMGVAIISPDHLRQNAHLPHVVIEQVIADKKEYESTDPLTLPPGRAEIAIRYTALSLVNPAQVRFRYRLSGLDGNWVDAGTNRVAHFGGLPAGQYRFEVVACNDEGIWSLDGASCDFTLLPHFYQRWWFIGAIGLIISSAGYGLFLWRNRRLELRAQGLERQNDELERKIADRTAELRESYDALRASEYFYHSLVESLPYVIVRKDTRGRCTYANALAAELFQRPLGEIIGRTDRELLPDDLAARIQADDQRVLTSRQPMETEEISLRPDRTKRYLHVKRLPLYDSHNRPLGIQVIFWDMTVFRETETKLKTAQKELMEISRLAGIAEMATGVLHNLGNALNSVKVAATIARQKVTTSEAPRVMQVADLLAAESDRLSEFLANDPRGQKLPRYMALLGSRMQEERQEVLSELNQLITGIDHAAQIIAAQQAGARARGLVEHVTPMELAEYACGMHQALIDRQNIEITREFMPTPSILVDRQKVLQILSNLIRNAIDSIVESARPAKQMVVAVRPDGVDGVQIVVADNGIGIGAENLTRIFEFGFTTKPNGHGFGLHNSGVAAQELGGALRVTSKGAGTGATFTLHLPLTPPPAAKPPAAIPPETTTDH